MLRFNLWNVGEIFCPKKIDLLQNHFEEEFSQILISFLFDGIAAIIAFRDKHPVVREETMWSIFNHHQNGFSAAIFPFFSISHREEPAVSVVTPIVGEVGGNELLVGAIWSFSPTNFFQFQFKTYGDDDGIKPK